MEFILYFLVFIFGYYTHKTFHIYESTRSGIVIFMRAQIVSVLALLRVYEQYNYIKTYASIEMKKSGVPESQIKSYNIMINNDIESFKKESIKSIIKDVPEYLKVAQGFDDWDSALVFLASHTEKIPKELR